LIAPSHPAVWRANIGGSTFQASTDILHASELVASRLGDMVI
jgi:hypothetical protein